MTNICGLKPANRTTVLCLTSDRYRKKRLPDFEPDDEHKFVKEDTLCDVCSRWCNARRMARRGCQIGMEGEACYQWPPPVDGPPTCTGPVRKTRSGQIICDAENKSYCEACWEKRLGEKMTCIAIGCNNVKKYADGMCRMHSPRGHCVETGCNNVKKYSDGMCKRHSPLGHCVETGCNNLKQFTDGMCKKHSPHGRCVETGCKNQNEFADGMCGKHSPLGRCVEHGCFNRKHFSDGLCKKHSPLGRCTRDGCKNVKKRGGFCASCSVLCHSVQG